MARKLDRPTHQAAEDSGGRSYRLPAYGSPIGEPPGDRVFKKPLRIRAIVDAADADRLVAEALWAKGEPFLVGVAHQERAEGKAEGRAEGKAEGRAEGHAEGLAEAILRALQRHGIAVTAAQRGALLTCHDAKLLTRWLDKVLVGDTAMEVLAELKKRS
jgi:hypothetical protein